MKYVTQWNTARQLWQLCLIAILIITSSVTTVIAGQATPPATSTSGNDTQLYVGHGAQLIAEMPAHWRPDHSLEYDYVFRNAFIASVPIPANRSMFDSLSSVCDYVVESVFFQQQSEVEHTTWRDAPACILHTVDRNTYDPVTLIFAHPDPHEDGHNAYVAVTIDAAHFDQIIATISFDTDPVTPEIYLDTAIDFIQTHSLQRDAIDWDQVREEAHAFIDDFSDLGYDPATLDISIAHAALEYVLDQLRQAGADNHNWFRSSGGSILPERNYVGPTGEVLSDDIGYISVPGFIGDEGEATRFMSEIRTILTSGAESSTCGWIVDLRSNTGGNMYPMVGGLAPLLTPGHLISFRDASDVETKVSLSENGVFRYDDERMDAYSTAISPESSNLQRQPVAVLIGPQNGSAGEATALAFAPRSHTGFVGETTAGVATAPTHLHLIDGALLSIATSWMVGPQGAIYPDGIHPDVTVSPSEVFDPIDEDPVVQTAAEWLTEQSACVMDGATPAG